MKMLLDTTYLLPAIGISIKGIPQDAVLKLIEKGHIVFISDITIFELSAKGSKYVAEEKLSPERVSKGIRTIVYDENITKLSIHDTLTLHMAFKLRRLLNDFIDCLITSSAISACNVVVTEDEHIKNLRLIKSFQDIIKTINPKFEIRTVKELFR